MKISPLKFLLLVSVFSHLPYNPRAHSQSSETKIVVPASAIQGDANGDGIVDQDDLLMVKKNWKQGSQFEDDLVVINIPGLAEGARPMRLSRIHSKGKSFLMGSPETERGRSENESPQHPVSFDYDYYVAETEVTQAQWKAVMGYDAVAESHDPNYGLGDDFPVYFVSWHDCNAFAEALSLLGQGTFRLPSEAEWEYAARGGSSARFFFGDSLGCDDACANCETAKGEILIDRRADYMWFCSDRTFFGSRIVGQKFSNQYRLYDMLGNLTEWVRDTFHSTYDGAPDDGSSRAAGDSSRKVVRGGFFDSTAELCRSARRSSLLPTARGFTFGFRVARNQ